MKLSGRMPDLTLAQITAVVGWVVAQAVAFGWVDGAKSQALVSGGATILFASLKLADAWIRTGRAKAVAANPSLVNQNPPQA